MQSPSKFQHNFYRHQKSKSQLHMEKIINPGYQKNRTSRGITIPDLNLYYREIVIKTASYWYRNRYIENQMEDAENLFEFSQPIDT